MRRLGLLWQFYPPLLTILVISLVLVTGFSGRAMRSFMVGHTTENLEVFAKALAPEIALSVSLGDFPAIQQTCRRIGQESGYRLTVILGGGQVVGDSNEDPELMENHALRPEIASALKGETGVSQRYSSTLGHQRLYVAVPGVSIPEGQSIPFVVRTSVSLDDLGNIMGRLYREIALVSLALVVLAGIFGYILARKLSNSLQHLQHGAEAFADGNLTGRIKVNDSLEIDAVAASMNHMADQLADRIRSAENKRNELEAVLASMNEGILAVDNSENIIRLNKQAAGMLGQDQKYALGRSIQEIGRHPELTQLAQNILNNGKTGETDVKFGSLGGRLIHVQASSLVNLEDQRIGALLVLSDITELRRLETMRRDFVANVSHELKTPVTSIKGFVETLLDDPPESQDDAHHFLEIINRQTDRLENIIGDLLALSRLEEENRTGNLEMVEQPLGPMIERIVKDIKSRDPQAGIRLEIQCEDQFRCQINSPLLEQAIGNLMDNALIYSPVDSPVLLTCGREGSNIVIKVKDQGPGISAEHLPRLFERFYRVDKARSRRLGGTGLGLAIVKHITQIHGGQATVISTPGEGSTFILKLPLEANS